MCEKEDRCRELLKLELQVTILREILRPFAALADAVRRGEYVSLDASDFERARAVLHGKLVN